MSQAFVKKNFKNARTYPVGLFPQLMAVNVLCIIYRLQIIQCISHFCSNSHELRFSYNLI